MTELAFILDRSGSMQSSEGDTVGGFDAGRRDGHDLISK